jgi:hypothetical protein
MAVRCRLGGVLAAAIGGQLVKGRIRRSMPVAPIRPARLVARSVRELKNPYFIGDDPSLTQTMGWVDAWTSQPSAYAVAARSTRDVAAAVTFARANRLRLVVRGGGHSYLGTSNAPDSLLIWTRAMNEIVLHDRFVARGCARQAAARLRSPSAPARSGCRRTMP